MYILANVHELENMAKILQFEEAESVESKFQPLVDLTDALVGKQDKLKGLPLEGDNPHYGKGLGTGSKPI